jgi:hypothetical protein
VGIKAMGLTKLFQTFVGLFLQQIMHKNKTLTKKGSMPKDKREKNPENLLLILD